MSYNHLTQEQRSQIQVLKSMGHTQKDIANAIEVHASTISRELRRNKGGKGYRYKQAHTMAVNRRSEASSIPNKMTERVVAFIESKILNEQWSPEQISGVLAANDEPIRYDHI